jgi:voltage-gated potassium channel
VRYTTDERGPGRPRTPADARVLARFDAVMALPLVLAAVLPLLLLPGDDEGLLAAAVNIVAWVVFIVDFVVHRRRLDHYLATWLGPFDLLVVVLTVPWFLLPGVGESRFVILIRLARIARLLMAGTGARRLFERLGRVAVISVAVVVLGSAAAGATSTTDLRAEVVELRTQVTLLTQEIVRLTTQIGGPPDPHVQPSRRR